MSIGNEIIINAITAIIAGLIIFFTWPLAKKEGN